MRCETFQPRTALGQRLAPRNAYRLTRPYPRKSAFICGSFCLTFAPLRLCVSFLGLPFFCVLCVLLRLFFRLSYVSGA